MLAAFNNDDASAVPSVHPKEAWEMLKSTSGAHLVDVRSEPEWAFSGTPLLYAIGKEPILIAWRNYPDFSLNLKFFDSLEAARRNRGYEEGEAFTLLFICKTGGRSLEAAKAVAERFSLCCYNVAEGFEGMKDEVGRRGNTSGWKAAGLPWIQT